MAKRKTLSWKHNGHFKKQWSRYAREESFRNKQTDFMDVDPDVWATEMGYDNCDDGCPEEE